MNTVYLSICWFSLQFLSSVCYSFLSTHLLRPSIMFPGSSAGKETACNAGDPSSIPGLGRPHRKGIGYPLQYSWAPWWLRWQKICLQCGRYGFDPWVRKIPWRSEQLPLQYSGMENSMDYIVHGVAKSQTWTEQLSLSFLGILFFVMQLWNCFFLFLLVSCISLAFNILMNQYL